MPNYSMHIAEAAEAINGALHRFAFRHLGDKDASTWFTRGDYPKDIRIEVVKSNLAPMVLVNQEWRNLTTNPVTFGRRTLQIDVRGSQNDVFKATEKAVLSCLELYRDVLEGKGVAGPQAAHSVIESTADSAVPDTFEDEQDAGL